MDITEIHRYLSGEATDEEKNALEKWLDRSEKNRKLFESYREIYSVEIQHSYHFDTEKALNRFREVMEGEKPVRAVKLPAAVSSGRRHTGIWWKAAAAILILVSVSVVAVATWDFAPEEEAYAEEVLGTTISTDRGEQKSFRLRDGSRVRLNADSEIYIPENFGAENREVRLSGEAFFEVAAIDGSGFEVETRTARIEVLGTSFGIRAWRDRDEAVVAVQTGRVSVRSANVSVSESTVLEPGEYSRVGLDVAPTLPQKVNINQFIGWTNQLFVFDETPLRDVLKQLELHFNVEIVVKDSSSIDDPVTARYRNESLQEILEYTSITHGVNFEIQPTP